MYCSSRTVAPVRIRTAGVSPDREMSDQEEPDEEPLEEGESVQDDSNEDTLEDMTPSAYTRDILQQINGIWPIHFSCESLNVVHGFGKNVCNSRDIKLHITNLSDLSHTWLMDLEGNEDITENHWTEEMRGKMNKNPFVPRDSVKEFPKRLPYKFQQKSAQQYFAAPDMGFNKKVTLPTVIFSQEYTKTPENTDHLFEFYGRQGSLDCQITHKLLEMQVDMVSNISEALDCLDVSDSSSVHFFAIKEGLDSLMNTITLAKQSNYRAKSFSIATSCKSKLKIRESILNKYDGDVSIKDALKGSNFFTNQLFGPISKSLQDKLDSYVNRSEAKLTPKKPGNNNNDSNYRRGRTPNALRGARKRARSEFVNYGNSFDRAGSSKMAMAPSVRSGASSSGSNPLFQERPQRGHRGRNQKGRGSRKY